MGRNIAQGRRGYGVKMLDMNPGNVAFADRES